MSNSLLSPVYVFVSLLERKRVYGTYNEMKSNISNTLGEDSILEREESVSDSVSRKKLYVCVLGDTLFQRV